MLPSKPLTDEQTSRLLQSYTPATSALQPAHGLSRPANSDAAFLSLAGSGYACSMSQQAQPQRRCVASQHQAGSHMYLGSRRRRHAARAPCGLSQSPAHCRQARPPCCCRTPCTTWACSSSSLSGGSVTFCNPGVPGPTNIMCALATRGCRSLTISDLHATGESQRMCTAVAMPWKLHMVGLWLPLAAAVTTAQTAHILRGGAMRIR